MNRLLLIAASGLAREALAVERALGRFARIRVLDDDPDLWGSSLDGEPVVGGLELVREDDDHRVLVCASKGPTRRAIVDRLTDMGVTHDRFARTVHPDVDIPPGCSVGAGSILLAGVVLTANVRMGNHVVVMPNVSLTHDDMVADFATICAGVALGGGVHVGSGAYLGMNSSVREGLSIGHDAVLGMGSVLLTELPAGQTWAGVPARPVEAIPVQKVRRDA
ncbi:acetyltransferase [Nocardioides speluncae]|uniref:acetyltransferase n=1 Tax=Nocardioides speluncae TaxID=2670337 RepID=UPI000D6985A4|nr:acetyltransferase [Nocardioides speluncae]